MPGIDNVVATMANRAREAVDRLLVEALARDCGVRCQLDFLQTEDGRLLARTVCEIDETLERGRVTWA